MLQNNSDSSEMPQGMNGDRQEMDGNQIRERNFDGEMNEIDENATSESSNTGI